MNTEQIIQHELDSFADAFYGWLIHESDGELLSDTLRQLFIDAGVDDWRNVAFILDGLEATYFADYTYFRSENYDGRHYMSIPFGEIEVEWSAIDDDSKEDFAKNGEYGYHAIPAITFVYDLETVKTAIADYLED